MSHENVEIARRFADHWNEAGEPFWAAMDPDVVWVVNPPAFLAGTYHGHKGVRTLLGRIADVFGQLRVELDELVEAGDAVVGLGRFRVSGALSGATGTQQIAVVLELRDGRIVAYRSYLRREEAFEAVRFAQPEGRGDPS